jgi:hypothetical protein
MASLPVLRQALYDVLSTIDDLTVYTTTPETNPNYPALLIQPATATFTTALARNSGQDVYEFDLVILVSGADVQIAQDALDEYLVLSGPNSIRQLINENPKLGLANDSSRTTAHIDRMESYGITQSRDPQVRDFGAVLRLIVRTTG